MTEITSKILFESRRRTFLYRVLKANWFIILFYIILVLSFNFYGLFHYKPNTTFNIILITLLLLNLFRFSYWYRFSLNRLEVINSEVFVVYQDFNKDKFYRSKLKGLDIFIDGTLTIGKFKILVLKKKNEINLRFYRLGDFDNTKIENLTGQLKKLSSS